MELCEMSINKSCSLCCNFCTDYELLLNEEGECTKFYEITVKYFDPMLLMEEENVNSGDTQVLCLDCWLHISDFHDFQQTVLKARSLWKDKKQLGSSAFVVKEEEYQMDEDASVPHTKCFERNEKEIIAEDDCLEDTSFKAESLTSFEDNHELIENPTIEKLVHEEGECSNELEVTLKIKRVRNPNKGRNTQNTSYDSDLNGLNSKDKIQRLTKGKNAKERPPLARAKDSNAFIAQWKPELSCDVCGETTNNYDKLRNHFKENHKTRFYTTCCERKFYRRNVLVNHIRLHVNPETHKCDICGKSSTTKDNLKLHKRVVHQDTKQLKCDVCERLFKQKVTLERHLLTHTTSREDFICSECGKGYVAEELLNLHTKRVHTGSCVCDQCGKSINGIQALKMHLMEHAGIKVRPFPCDICGLELKSNFGLKKHKAAFHNDGTTIYICADCGKVFPTEVGLSRHKKLVHVDERKHKCTICQKAFKQPKSLREHIATHTGEDLYQCPLCPQTFKVSSNMYQHRKKVHPVEYEEIRKNRLQQPKINIDQVKKQVVL